MPGPGLPETDFNDLVSQFVKLHGRHLERQRALVNAAPFGMPSLPPLPPPDDQGELRSSNTPVGDRYAERFNSPTLGRVVSAIDRAGDVGKSYAMGGINTIDAGMRNLGEATQGSPSEWDYPRAAGALGQGAAG